MGCRWALAAVPRGLCNSGTGCHGWICGPTLSTKTNNVSKPHEIIGFGAMDVTKPFKFIRFGAMDVTKPFKFIGFGAMAVTNAYNFIGFGSTLSTKTKRMRPRTRPRPRRSHGRPDWSRLRGRIRLVLVLNMGPAILPLASHIVKTSSFCLITTLLKPFKILLKLY